jgi:anti-sigma regulatory factor (Ser/Thr protein kinase)
MGRQGAEAAQTEDDGASRSLPDPASTPGRIPGSGERADLPIRPLPALIDSTPLASAREVIPLPAGDHRVGPGTYARTDLAPDLAAAARARRLTRETLGRWRMDALADDAQAVASELASNAIAAAVAPCANLPAIIFALHRRPAEVRIIVWDNGPGRPRPAEPGTDDENGRGLAIVDALTGRNWGWWHTPCSGGKVIWAALPVPSDSACPDDRDPCLLTPSATPPL